MTLLEPVDFKIDDYPEEVFFKFTDSEPTKYWRLPALEIGDLDIYPDLEVCWMGYVIDGLVDFEVETGWDEKW